MNILRNPKRFGSLALLGALMTAAGCGGSAGGGAGAGSGTLSLRITDAAVDSAEHVYIQFSGLEIQGGGHRTTLYYCQDPADPTKTIVSAVPCTTLAAPKKLDLLLLTGGLAEVLLDDFPLPAGHYNWIRLAVDTAGTRDSYIVLPGGAEHELVIPSGDETGLKLNHGFDVPAGGSADFTIDFDLRKSVHVTGTGVYRLRPTLRLADNALTGAIAGTVDPALVPAGCTPAVYVFEGGGVVPDDIDGTAPEPVTTATVKLDGGVYKYQAAFLEAGSYTVAYTCQAALDDPVVNDALVFSGAATVAVAAKTTTVHNF